MTANSTIIARLDARSEQIREAIADLVARRDALFAELVKEGRTVQSRLEKTISARIEQRKAELKNNLRFVESLRQKTEKTAKSVRRNAEQRLSRVRDRVESDVAGLAGEVEARSNKVRDRIEDGFDDMRSALDQPIGKLYARLNLATRKDLKQLSRQINALQVRVTALKAA